MADEIKLTLGVPQAPNATEAVAEAAAEEQAVAQQVQADAAAKQVFSPEEQKMIDDFSKQIFGTATWCLPTARPPSRTSRSFPILP